MRMPSSIIPRHLPGLVLLSLAALALLACSAKTITVTVPPRLTLTGYPAVGVLEFVSQQPALGEDATRKFIADLHAAQPGVRILELGNQERVLEEVGHNQLDYRAIRAIGAKFGVEALITGSVELAEPRPDLKLSTDLSAVSATAKVDGKMSGKLWETGSGASIWSNSSWGSWSVGGVRLGSNGRVQAGYHYPKEKQDQILLALIEALNGEFWPTYEKRRVEGG